MHALELRIPPPAVALLLALVMWSVSSFPPSFQAPFLVRVIAAVFIALVGAGICLAGVASFRRARTTINPMKPNMASALVTSGIYHVTRNPMYLGWLLALIAWAVFLSNAWAFVGPLVFVQYMNRFQIIPEERVLSTMFGEEYAAYKSKVRRWL